MGAPNGAADLRAESQRTYIGYLWWIADRDVTDVARALRKVATAFLDR